MNALQVSEVKEYLAVNLTDGILSRIPLIKILSLNLLLRLSPL